MAAVPAQQQPPIASLPLSTTTMEPRALTSTLLAHASGSSPPAQRDAGTALQTAREDASRLQAGKFGGAKHSCGRGDAYQDGASAQLS